MTSPARVHVGVDIGGSTTKIVLLDSSLDVVDTASVATISGQGAPAMLDRVACTIRALDGVDLGHGLTVGVALPGNVDRVRQVPVYVPALGVEWEGVAIASCTREALEPLTVDALEVINDVQAMTLAEWQLGAARGHHDVLCVALGTGVGGGVVVGGRLHLGVDDTAGAIGHTTVEPAGEACTCGNLGCLERFASGPAIATAAGTATAEAATSAAGAGDPVALAALHRAAAALGVAIGNVCTMLTPTAVVIGGGVASAGPLLIDRVRDEVARRVTVASFARTRLVSTAFGPMAGAVGAALAATPALSRAIGSP